MGNFMSLWARAASVHLPLTTLNLLIPNYLFEARHPFNKDPDNPVTDESTKELRLEPSYNHFGEACENSNKVIRQDVLDSVSDPAGSSVQHGELQDSRQLVATILSMSSQTQNNKTTEPRPIPTNEGNSTSFDKDIKLLAANGTWVYATALLDTQCHLGNWISWRLVQRLGKLSLISTDFNPPEMVDVSGRSVNACGVVDLNWKWHPRGTRNNESQFYVFPESGHLDVLFGVDYILSENLLRVNESAIAPLVEHKKLKKDDKAAIAKAKKRQKEEKAALEERKRREEEKKESQQAS